MRAFDTKFGRWLVNLAYMPHRVAEIVEYVRALYASQPTPTAVAAATDPILQSGVQQGWASEIYRGYSDEDVRLFGKFAGRTFRPEPGMLTDFLGVRTRAAFLLGLDAPNGVLLGIPIPNDNVHAETVEWVGLLKSVLSARGALVGMELGAGWGPWLVAAAAAARYCGITEIHLTGVEGDPGHFDFMWQHFLDNGLTPAEHTLIQGAVGVESGKARWPRVADPSADWGSRPMTDDAGEHDHLGRQFESWLDVEVHGFNDLLLEHEVWDLVHIDVQGGEFDLCVSAADRLDARVRWLIVATHDPKLHGLVLGQLHQRGWELENEKPPRLQWYSGAPSVQNMIAVDGTQVWRNPALTDAA